jgi:transcriptional regulator with XRE-family HTH domain
LQRNEYGGVAVADVTEARTCAQCGKPLSRYNQNPRCGTCTRLEGQPTPAADGPWLNRPDPEDSGPDDAGAVLRGWRTSTGQSQVEAARMLGMTQQNLSNIENGRQHMPYELRQRVVNELGIPPEALGLASARPRSADDATPEVAADQARWRYERWWLNEHRAELAKLSAALYPADLRVPDTTLIAADHWIPAEPIDLQSLSLTLDERPHPAAVDGTESTTERVRPLCTPTHRFDSYTSTIRHLDPPRLFESRPSYRLLGEQLAASRTLHFGLSTYFEKLDVSEALGHELAVACISRGEVPTSPNAVWDSTPFRTMIEDPFDPARRAIIPAVTTLTIRLRRYPAPPTFLLHWRDPAKVATAAGVYDVVPAGEFQPASVDLWDRRNDFDVWRNIVREYSEELLGMPEHDGTRSRPIDYDGWPLYRALGQAQQAGSLASYALGLGLDALTLAATILTVVVIDDDVFGEVFGSAVRTNAEGEIVAIGDGRATEGVPFTAESVHRLLSSEPMASPGAACLALAWRHRQRILGL